MIYHSISDRQWFVREEFGGWGVFCEVLGWISGIVLICLVVVFFAT